MKKILIALIGILLFTGCTDMMNTPTKRVEEFLGKYQTMDKEVLEQLEDVLEKEDTMSDDQKKDYRDLMKKQYQNLFYKIKDETVDGDTATVEVEIEVYDYHTAIEKAEKYLEEHKDEFLASDKTVDHKKYMDYKIKQIKDQKEKIKYTLNFTLTKKEKEWKLDDISEMERMKLHGLYNY